MQKYNGIPQMLHGVRWTQHLFAILAEVLILISFAISAMDISVGGVMASTAWLKWLWAVIFSLGVDTAFVLSWVRTGKAAMGKRWGSLIGNLLLALGLSWVTYQTVAIQLLQQSLSISFLSALGHLGINLIVLVYARSIIAVLLGGILAITNVESYVPTGPQRRIVFIDKLLDRVAPVIVEEGTTEQVSVSEDRPAQIEAPKHLVRDKVEALVQQHPRWGEKRVLEQFPAKEQFIAKLQFRRIKNIPLFQTRKGGHRLY